MWLQNRRQKRVGHTLYIIYGLWDNNKCVSHRFDDQLNSFRSLLLKTAHYKSNNYNL